MDRVKDWLWDMAHSIYPVGIIFWVASIIAVFPLLIALLVEKFWGGLF